MLVLWVYRDDIGGQCSKIGAEVSSESDWGAVATYTMFYV